MALVTIIWVIKPGTSIDRKCCRCVHSVHSLLRYDTKDQDFIHLNETLWKMSSLVPNMDQDHRSLGQYLEDQNVSSAMIALADAGYANTAGSSCHTLSYAATARYGMYVLN